MVENAHLIKTTTRLPPVAERLGYVVHHNPTRAPKDPPLRNSFATIIAALILFSCADPPVAVSHKAVDSTTAPSPDVDWRRTRYGWQRIRVVEPTPRPTWFAVGAMHPSVLALFELTASLAALIAFASEKEIERKVVCFKWLSG